MTELEGKQLALAKLIDGQVVDDTERVAVHVKGSINGFPATLQAFSTGWPFGCMYAIETNVVETEPANPLEHAKITILPRMGRGPWSFFFHTFLFESKGRAVRDKKLESKLIFSYDNAEPALRFCKYPGVPDILLEMEKYSKIKELVIKTDQGLYLSQGISFKNLDLDVCQATFKWMGELGQVLHDAFQK